MYVLEHFEAELMRIRLHEVVSVGLKPITLVLMMINSCSYCTNDLVFSKSLIYIKILVGV